MYNHLVAKKPRDDFRFSGGMTMKHIQTIKKGLLKESLEKGGCGECQASCQSACKTSCTVANQKCEKKD
jgi:predicted ribosomally synthesized six-cysteine peptide SCIFF